MYKMGGKTLFSDFFRLPLYFSDSKTFTSLLRGQNSLSKSLNLLWNRKKNQIFYLNVKTQLLISSLYPPEDTVHSVNKIRPFVDQGRRGKAFLRLVIGWHKKKTWWLTSQITICAPLLVFLFFWEHLGRVLPRGRKSWQTGKSRTVWKL